MSDNSQIQRLPVEVDPFKLVEQGRQFKGRMPLSDFPRLKDLLYKSESKTNEKLVKVDLEFARNETGLPVIKGQITAEMQMICNRCLDATALTVETQTEVVLVGSDAQAERLQDSFDIWLVEDQTLVLKDFIEDELLLAMPLVIAHDECEPARRLIEALPEDEYNDEQKEKDNPFAALKDIKLN
ncbi:YceD family protein [Cocleimonas sp. KMM 6892]|uniref:YceD family protein n=1 Tax=unclassified Cocleimonas TaxID=2639732 RepID=UPI002DBD9329|nr:MULTISPECIES: YceD family protein [unclassified Cocleimonas]MEB8433477.1 YceD family protein [Cocleimonas sp. KMM 6892]MEC4716288.1 YceD family protein [Cocleimonas sp. KMM 6895]MEC4745819.1 YceD family protein [Cocleimonas sp. KMM 6896]